MAEYAVEYSKGVGWRWGGGEGVKRPCHKPHVYNPSKIELRQKLLNSSIKDEYARAVMM